jgi:hypothetical protein
MSPPPAIPDRFRRQAHWCDRLGSPLYSDLLSRCADDYEKGGALNRLLSAHESDTEARALPLRLMGAAHRLVLEGRAPKLAKFYPSVGGTVEHKGAWSAFRDTVEEQMESLHLLIRNPVQTNDVGRSGSLLGGFGLIAEQTQLALRLLEIGTSAGLNLRWDRYRYEWSGGAWGDAASAVRLENVFVGEVPSIPSHIEIVERAGCDPAPVDISNESGCLTLLSYTWPDQIDRIRRLDAAIKKALYTPCAIEKAHGADWLEKHLQRSFAGAATVVFHSVVWPYISEPERERIARIIHDAGSSVSESSPLAWLRMEPNKDEAFEIRLRIYPGFEERVIATSSSHAPSVSWLL